MIAYAHQGGSWEAPSSTLFAISHALEAGANAIELDVHASLDGELVVCHDASVDQTTNGRGKIVDMTLSELSELDNAYWFVEGVGSVRGYPESAYIYRGRASSNSHFRIATLREVLEKFPGVVLNLDIKQTTPTVPPYEESLARLLDEFKRSDDVIVASFLDYATDSFSKYSNGRVPTSAGTLASIDFWRSVQSGQHLEKSLNAVALQLPEFEGDLRIVDKSLVAGAHELGVAVHVWTVNDIDTMERLVGLGVDGIITDVPSILAKVLATNHATWYPNR